MYKEVLNRFHLCLEISCSHPCSKEKQIWRFKSHGSQIVCHYFISSFFFKREIDTFFQRVFIVVHQIFMFSLIKLKQGWDKTAWTQRGILTKYSQCTSKGDLCLHCSLCIFFWCTSRALIYLPYEFSFRTSLSVWSLPCRR